MATQTHILFLQHPQEPDHDLGSARIAHLALGNSTLRTGLSWPNLQKAAQREAQPSRWAVLYLGSGIQGKRMETDSPLQFVSRKGLPVPAPQGIEGVVVLDGTWSQAKTLWWRNAWLLKLNRAVLVPEKKSLYKELRREPRRECLSTIESVAEVLGALGENSEVSNELRSLFSKLLDKQRERLRRPRTPHTKPEPLKTDNENKT